MRACSICGGGAGELRDFGIHGVPPKFIEETRASGAKDLTPRKLVEMRIFRHRER